MAMGLGRFTHWLWPGNAARVGNHELPGTALTGASFPEFPSGFREADALAFSTAAAGGRRARQRRVKNQRRSRGEPRIDREYDMVIVPSDGGGCLSGSESDDSDWSIGWLEPQAPEMQTDGDQETSFAVLVPCYRHGRAEQPAMPQARFLGAGPLADRGLSGEWFAGRSTKFLHGIAQKLGKTYAMFGLFIKVL
ncbi:hypothetical protein D1007_20313 [Hordeum vulgare]|uniref:Uncharacterized protein n=1 Tax=Hordeum vulgare subsp. vulgare TaxID=112509 RepID=A0A8I6XN17_HORVV|nr:hypothetical protein D1007_20313 [Hordeum vulgare]